MRLLPFASDKEVGIAAANFVARRINEFLPTPDKPFVLGLPTGSTPLLAYKILVDLYRSGNPFVGSFVRQSSGELSFKNVVTFNMDEYIGIPRDHPQSYHTYMNENFFRHIDILPDNINLLDGNTSDHAAECARYEAKIRK